ncbi:hypothetical protein [Brevundimonas diminuta]|uniref:Uncharacterized protein n=1 Tax=Brevundimonas diminuta TaxID=293 RepID=A0A1Z3LZH9_BREDI|nr:hypothetical protein [Brevundimonas diminuta]ASD27495.1 hypothetical protein CD943_11700 [Brevundimonas diminuta]
MRQFIRIADDVDRADAPILDLQGGRLETAVRIVADIAGQAVDDRRADEDGAPFSIARNMAEQPDNLVDPVGA